MNSPTTAPTGRLSPTIADAGPRRCGASWSGITAVTATIAELNPTAVTTPAAVNPNVPAASSCPTDPTATSTAPSSRNGLRLPSREVVRSLIRPSTGNATSENNAPTPATMDTIVVAPSGSIAVALIDRVRTSGTRFAIAAPIAAKPRKNRNPTWGCGQAVSSAVVVEAAVVEAVVVESVGSVWSGWSAPERKVLIVGHLSHRGRRPDVPWFVA